MLEENEKLKHSYRDNVLKIPVKGLKVRSVWRGAPSSTQNSVPERLQDTLPSILFALPSIIMHYKALSAVRERNVSG